MKVLTIGAISSFALTSLVTVTQGPVSAAQFSLDWGQIAQNGQWPNGSQNGSFEIGGGNIDISFQIGNEIQFIGFGNSGLTPAVNAVLNGDRPDEDPSLHLQIDSERVGLGRELHSVTMNTLFKGYQNSLEEVSFWLYDIDINEFALWQDRVSIKGYFDNRVVAPNFDFFDPTANTVEIVDRFTLDGIASVENDSDRGDVRVYFTEAIDRFSLTYTDGDDISILDPSGHGIGIGDIYFDVRESPPKTPEPNSSLALIWVGAGLCGLKGYLQKNLFLKSKE